MFCYTWNLRTGRHAHPVFFDDGKLVATFAEQDGPSPTYYLAGEVYEEAGGQLLVKNRRIVSRAEHDRILGLPRAAVKKSPAFPQAELQIMDGEVAL